MDVHDAVVAARIRVFSYYPVRGIGPMWRPATLRQWEWVRGEAKRQLRHQQVCSNAVALYPWEAQAADTGDEPRISSTGAASSSGENGKPQAQQCERGDTGTQCKEERAPPQPRRQEEEAGTDGDRAAKRTYTEEYDQIPVSDASKYGTMDEWLSDQNVPDTAILMGDFKGQNQQSQGAGTGKGHGNRDEELGRSRTECRVEDGSNGDQQILPEAKQHVTQCEIWARGWERKRQESGNDTMDQATVQSSSDAYCYETRSEPRSEKKSNDSRSIQSWPRTQSSDGMPSLEEIGPPPQAYGPYPVAGLNIDPYVLDFNGEDQYASEYQYYEYERFDYTEGATWYPNVPPPQLTQTQENLGVFNPEEMLESTR